MTLLQTLSCLSAGRPVDLVSGGPMPTFSPVVDARRMPAEIDRISAARRSGWYQVKIDYIGSPAWVNATPAMIGAV